MNCEKLSCVFAWEDQQEPVECPAVSQDPRIGAMGDPKQNYAFMSGVDGRTGVDVKIELFQQGNQIAVDVEDVVAEDIGVSLRVGFKASLGQDFRKELGDGVATFTIVVDTNTDPRVFIEKLKTVSVDDPIEGGCG